MVAGVNRKLTLAVRREHLARTGANVCLLSPTLQSHESKIRLAYIETIVMGLLSKTNISSIIHIDRVFSKYELI